eukprot:TRINITY_DN97358_c0_g1_i1.p1 TRINITY_DN97358_c0_g1~~TRINITY_DN97358_c0_g1_i1.p1  ORF type:complete len:186 (-),score=20.75 TRINITY_DN97358_c0_g1_i1:17-574(-)
MGKKVNCVQRPELPAAPAVSLVERYQRRLQAEREYEGAGHGGLQASSGIGNELDRLKTRLYTSKLYQENLQRHQQNTTPRQMETFEHKTTKHKAPVEARGTIVNAMMPKHYEFAPEHHPEAFREQLELRKTQQVYPKERLLVVNKRIIFDEGNVVVNGHVPQPPSTRTSHRASSKPQLFTPRSMP